LADLIHMPASDGVPLRDFLEDAFQSVEWGELRAVVGELAAKSARTQSFLRPAERLRALSSQDLAALLDMIFVARRHRDELRSSVEHGRFGRALDELLYGANDDLSERVDAFLARTQVIHRGMGMELAGELLHFAFPDRYWLCSRWMYDAEARTGALPLLLDGDKELRGDSLGQTYLRVGRALVLVTEVEDAKWLFQGGLDTDPTHRPFAIDTFLAATYGAYLYGVTAWRLTREFHKVLPPLPRLVRRLLGLKIGKEPNQDLTGF
jgi:hypothetical protein